ncbi:MAG: CDP-diacylglycerol--glycerol-3-phosphate 3-phosphatidyltransferase [Candidatus Cloacimonetes bacterium]|nr:CDP-diacylglycerol--glycerol-3-phosphate 3-phosphatidyltransferase [Candidatus Cloacimonadota bacterium]
MKKYIPNSLTLLRILLVPVFFWLVYYYDGTYNYLWATIVFILASITDIFDGLLARKFEVVTNFGKIMDPFADKLLILLAFYALVQKPLEMMSVYVFYIILAREIIISLLRQHYTIKKIYVSANIWGKIKTAFQMTSIISALVYYSILFPLIPVPLKPEYHSKFQFWFNIFFWIVAFVTIISGISYFLGKKQRGDH